MTTFSKNEETLENKVKVQNYHVTYEDIANVFSKIKNKGMLNETIILKGQANYKMNKTVVKSENKNAKRKSKKHVNREEELEL